MTGRRLAVLGAAGLLAIALELIVPGAAALASTPSPSPAPAPTSSGPDFRFILIGIGCILFAIVIARRGKREGRSERNWF